MIEVEIKLPIHRRSAIEHGLINLGFTPGDLIRESDSYFTSDFHDFMKTDEALRIRESENFTQASSTTRLTYKGPKLDTVSMTRKELETTVGDSDICCQILYSLGYHKLSPVVKLRQYYHLDTITACVDQVEKLGAFLELEIIVETEAEREDALKKIEAILNDLDCSMAETTRYSYLFMLLKKNRTC